MATLTELATITSDARWNGLMDRIKAASIKKSVSVINSAAPPVTRLDWAKRALENPNSAAHGVIWYAIGDSANATIDQIFGANDAAIESAVNTAVDALYAG